MAYINVGDLITNVKFAHEFNNKIWNDLLKGGIFNGSPGNVTTGDKVDNTAVVLYGNPRYSIRRPYGANKSDPNAPTGWFDRPPVMPANELRVVKTNEKLGITLDPNLFKDKIITAKELHDACLACVKALVRIRPFRGEWRHDGIGGGVTYFPNANSYSYGYFNDSAATGSTVNIGSGANWNTGNPVARWTNTKGTRINIVDVIMKGCSAGIIVGAQNSSDSIDTLFKTWRDNCFNTNAFLYRYYSCHLNCHSSCHYNHRSRR